MYLESRLILVDDGLSHKSIYTLAKKMEKVVFSALVKAEGFYPDINQFKVVVMAGQESAQILKIENRKPRNDGLFELGFVLDKGSRNIISNESIPFVVVTNSNQTENAWVNLMKYTFFDGETKNEITCAEFFSALRSFLAFETQGRKVADVVDELVAHHVLPEGTPVPRLLSEFEARHIARHFFGSDAGSVPRNGAFDEFLKWLRGTVDVLKNPPYNELFARGLIFLGLNAPEELLESSEIEFGTFFIVSELKVPGSMGIVVKSREGVLKRPLVCYNSTVSSVAASLMRACELKEMLEITLREVVVCDKAMCLGQLASSETEDPYAGTEFTDPPFVV